MQLGLAESARATTAQESRFRIDYPNSRPRRSCVIAIDPGSRAMLHRMASLETRPGARFLQFVEITMASASLPVLPVDAVVEHVNGGRGSLLDEIKYADIIVMVAVAGRSADAAEVIGNACFVHHKMATGLVLHSPDVTAEQLALTLIAFRPFAAMLVVSSGEEYVSEMLSALRV